VETDGRFVEGTAPRRREARPGGLRDDILDVAQRLVATKGFERMTIEDILSELHVSKGAFYHYYASKSDLLQALVARMGEDTRRMLRPILEDPSIPAVLKLQRTFDGAGRWKSARRDYLLSLLQVWYHDDNAVMRHRVRSDAFAWLTPLLANVVRQGIQERAFATRFPNYAGLAVYSLLFDLGDLLADGILSGRAGELAFAEATQAVAAFTDAIERVLGAQPGSLHLIDPHLLQEWYESPFPVA
jgi:AcrR family transcriptional regulator